MYKWCRPGTLTSVPATHLKQTYINHTHWHMISVLPCSHQAWCRFWVCRHLLTCSLVPLHSAWWWVWQSIWGENVPVKGSSSNQVILLLGGALIKPACIRCNGKLKGCRGDWNLLSHLHFGLNSESTHRAWSAVIPWGSQSTRIPPITLQTQAASPRQQDRLRWEEGNKTTKIWHWSAKA